MRGSRNTARLVAVAAMVLGALVLVALAARSDRAATLTPAPRAGSTASLAPPAASLPPAEEIVRDRDTQTRDMPAWLVWTMAIVAVAPIVIAALFLPSLVWAPAVRWRRRRRALREAAGPPPVDDEVHAAELAAAVDEGLRELDQGGPGEGVVASWVLLERAAAEAGTHRAAPDTPSELAGRLIDRHAVSSGPLLRLAELYREARFSRHELPEAAREEARAALQGLRAELEASPIGGRR